MASLKVIGLVCGGVLVATGAIVGMNMAASGGPDNFEGGVTSSKLPRQLPNANADPFDVVSDSTEAARRATSNREIAEQTVNSTDQPSYTAPPVIQIEGSSGDESDPMADALVDAPTNEPPPPSAPLAVGEKIEAAQAPERDYKIPDRQQEASSQAPRGAAFDGLTMQVMRSALSASTTPSVATQSYDRAAPGASPMVMQRFGGTGQEDGTGNAGLPYSEIRQPKTPSGAASNDAAPAAPGAVPAAPVAATGQPAQPSAPEDRKPIMTIDPAKPSSYTEGALRDAVLGEDRLQLARSFDASFDGDRSYQVAQNEIEIGNNAQIYDPARNAMGFDQSTVLTAGDQRYATLMYGFNSDDASQLPVFAQIHDYSNGSAAYLNGARAQGTLKLSRESAVMEFSKLILPNGRVVPISAMAISADQGRVGVYDNVDRHVLARYSSLFVSGLIAGIGDVGERIIDNRYSSDSGTTIIVGDDASTSDSDGEFTDADRAAIAMGAVSPIGDVLVDNAKQGFNRKPTVTAPAGFGMTIVFLDSLTYGQVQ